MFYILSSLGLLIIHAILYMGTKVNIFPELFVFPWLISKGLVPYRDFFDHHGVFLYYLLSLLSGDKSLTQTAIFYNVVQLVNLALVLGVLRKITSKFWYLICGLLFILLNYYFSDGTFWFEHLFVLISLITYVTSEFTASFRGKNILLGGLLFLDTLIKPTYGLLLIPYSISRRSFKPGISFAMLWLLYLGYLYLNRSLGIFLDSMFVFNAKAVGYIKDYYVFGIEPFIFNLIAVIAVVSTVMYLLLGKMPRFFLLIVYISFGYVLQGYTKINLLPFIPFFVFLIAYVGSGYSSKTRWMYFLLVVFLCLFCLYRVVKRQYIIGSKTNVPYIESLHIRQCMDEIHNSKIPMNNSIYFDSPEYYYLLNQIPPSYYLLDLEFITKYRIDYEKRIIQDLEKRKANYVLLRSQNKRKNSLPTFAKFLSSDYSVLKVTECFSYFSRK